MMRLCLSGNRSMAVASTSLRPGVWSRAHLVVKQARGFQPLAKPSGLSRRAGGQRLRCYAAASNGRSKSSSHDYDYDLFTIGAGSGGVRASRIAASNYGAKVAVCEMPYSAIATDDAGGAGGTCVLRGCVPKKLFVYASEFREVFKDARGFGFDANPDVKQDWSSFLAKKRKELERLHNVYMSLLSNANVDFIEGRGRLVDAHTVEVGGKKYTAQNILVATGARAFVPKFEGSEHCIVSDHILEVPKVPKRLVIVGSGYIAVEFASIFNGLGTEVHLVFRQDQPLRGFDGEVRDFAASEYAKTGMHLHAGFSPVSVTKAADGTFNVKAKTKDGKEINLEGADYVLAATGRRPNIRNLGLEETGVKISDKGAIAVDRLSRTNVPSVWAIGDVTDRMALTPVALMEGMALVKTLFAGQDTAPDHADIATAVFSHPEIGTVGLTEEQAAERYGDLDIFTSSFKPMRNTISGNEGRAFMKVIVATDSDRVVGIHMVGPTSGEIMQGFGVAVKMGLTKTQLDSVVGIHPTSAEEFVTLRTATRKVRAKEAVPA
ncbi:GSR2 [Auxenochlorella protothecoides x Auxenochlorella symbiontica]